jgi:hypothetical protein
MGENRPRNGERGRGAGKMKGVGDGNGWHSPAGMSPSPSLEEARA